MLIHQLPSCMILNTTSIVHSPDRTRFDLTLTQPAICLGKVRGNGWGELGENIEIPNRVGVRSVFPIISPTLSIVSAGDMGKPWGNRIDPRTGNVRHSPTKPQHWDSVGEITRFPVRGMV